MLPRDLDQLATCLNLAQFQKLLKTDATTEEGQMIVAQYYGVEKEWACISKEDSLLSYYKLLHLVKT
jgi:hypothetical protein